MKIYCLEDFKGQFEKLLSRKQYRSLQREIIDYFFNKSIDELLSGTRLNNSSNTPYIKKRLQGSGGFRCYFLLLVKNDNLYLMFVHPKTGPMGASNITNESKAFLYKKILECITSNDLYQMILDRDGREIIFNKL